MYIGTTVNESPVVAMVAGAAIIKGALRAVKMVGGKVQLASVAGEKVFGLLPAQTPDEVASDGDVTVQVMARGKWIAGAAIAAGAAVTTDAAGKAITAATGNAIVGYAMTAAAGAGSVIDVRITNAGNVA